MVCLYRETYNAYYYAPFCSIPFLITLVSFLVLILLPFFLQFSTIEENFWYTPTNFYEHPVIRYNDEYAISIIAKKNSISNTNNKKPYVFFYETSYQKINDFYEESYNKFIEDNNENEDNQKKLISINSISVTKEEVNNDDVIDSLNVKINLHLTDEDYIITDIKIMLFFDYILQTNAKYQFQTMCYLDAFSSNGISQFLSSGRLKLKQKIPFRMTEFYNMTYSTNYFHKWGILKSDFYTIYNNFTFGRDYSTKFEYIYKNIIPSNSDKDVYVNSIIEIPSYQQIIVGMPSYMNLKFKWIKYLAAFIPTYIIIWNYLNFFFKNRIANVSVQGDLPKTIN